MTLLHRLLEESVLEGIRPTREEFELRDEIFSFVKKKLEEGLSDLGTDFEVTLQGSARRGTWLRGNLELDVFVLFPPRKKEWIKAVAYPAIKKVISEIGEVEERFAEHPYVRTTIRGVPVEVVPAFKVPRASDAITAVDRTPFHTQWLLERYEEMGEELKDEARLLKAFFKGVGVYGAEVSVRGFSGYLTELLTIIHGGFKETIKAMANWRPPVVIDITGCANVKRFGKAPLVVVDPVDPKRNAAAAVAEETLSLTILASWRYVSSPSPRFYKRPPPPEASPKLPTYVVEVPVRGHLPPETVWGELRRISSSLIKFLRSRDFAVTRHKLHYEEGCTKAYLAIEVLADVLPEYDVILGPPVWSTKYVASFANAHPNPTVGPWVEGNRMFVVERRAFRTLKQAVEHYLKRLKAKSLDLDHIFVRKVEGVPREAWLRWFLYGKPHWW